MVGAGRERVDLNTEEAESTEESRRGRQMESGRFGEANIENGSMALATCQLHF